MFGGRFWQKTVGIHMITNCYSSYRRNSLFV